MDKTAWYYGINLQWVNTVSDYLVLVAGMVEEALADDQTPVPGIVQDMRDEAARMKAHIDEWNAKFNSDGYANRRREE